MGRVARQAPSSMDLRPEGRQAKAIPVGQDVDYALGSVLPGCIVVAANLRWFGRLPRAVDESGPDAVFSTKHVFPIDLRAEIEILERTRQWVKIRVLDGRFAGRTGFSIPEAVRECRPS